MKAWRLQFGLKSMLAAIAVAALILAVFAYYLRQAHVQEQRIVDLQKQGIDIYYDYEFDNEGNYIKNPKPHVPGWLVDLFGRNMFCRPRMVSCPAGTSDATYTKIADYWPDVILEELEAED